MALELETDPPVSEHRVQAAAAAAAAYSRAAAALFPEARVEAWLVYRDGLERA